MEVLLKEDGYQTFYDIDCYSWDEMLDSYLSSGSGEPFDSIPLI